MMRNIFLAILIVTSSFSFAQNTKYDIAFVLRGYDSTCYYCDSLDFDPRAKEIVEHLNKLSFEQISTYRIFVNGIDSRSPVNLQSAKDISTLQASLDGWPGSQWDWLRNRTDFWLVVPDNYRPIIANAIAWMKETKLDFLSWGNQTAEGKQHYSIIQNNVVRMGPSSASDFLSGLKMPSNYNPYDFKYTEIVLNSRSNSSISGGGAQSTLQYFGLLDANGNPYNDFYLRCSYVYHSPRTINFSNGIFTSIHEGIHALGMGTHDVDDSERNLSVMSSFGAIESFSMLPAWDRYYWTKWIPQSTITTDSTMVSDLKNVGIATDKSKKYIYQVLAGDSLGRGGTYKEKYDGKWYSYTVDNGGTLKFNSEFKNTNILAPINAILDVPIVKKLGDTISFYVTHDGSRNGIDLISYKWYKDDVLITASDRFRINEKELILNGVTPNDVGLYRCVISNKYGTVSTKQIQLIINCGVAPLVTPSVVACQNSGSVIVNAQANTGSSLLWYGSNASGGTPSKTAPEISSNTPGVFNYYVSQQNNETGCESARAMFTVTINPIPLPPSVRDTAYCINTNADTLRVIPPTGNVILWYGNNETGGTASSIAPKPITSIVGTTAYYLSQKINETGCESPRAKIAVVIKPIPSSPTLTRDADNNLVANTTNITWYKDGVKIADTAQKIKPTSSGYYSATTTLNGCISALSENYYYLTTSVINLSRDEYFRISPNPTTGEINLNYLIRSTKDIYINVIDLNGKTIINNKKVNNRSKLNFGSSMKGSYFIQVKDKDGKILTIEKLIKN